MEGRRSSCEDRHDEASGSIVYSIEYSTQSVNQVKGRDRSAVLLH